MLNLIQSSYLRFNIPDLNNEDFKLQFLVLANETLVEFEL